jgi:hypothetical protein
VLSANIQLKDNIFVKEVDTKRNYLLIRNTPTAVEYRIFTVTKDIPYSDTFNVEENWLITSTGERAKKCILR